jgi:dihydroorotate dehydrogenase
MGFPGRGAQAVLPKLAGNRPADVILGVNLGKNKDTPLEAAAGDYRELVRIFAPAADYLALNVSSPNTAGLRRLQARTELEALLTQVAQERMAQHAQLGKRIPVLVKLAPDLSDAELDDALEAIAASGMDGVIAANTTLRRDGLLHPAAGETGGLSGAPLAARSTQMVRHICRRSAGKLPVIAVGGILSAADARQKLDAGAALVQIYTGLVYVGPGLVRQIVSGLQTGSG